MKVGERIQCWSEKEMISKEYELITRGIWAERVPGKENCLEIKWIRDDVKENEE